LLTQSFIYSSLHPGICNEFEENTYSSSGGIVAANGMMVKKELGGL
jgi:hypothetical protein